MKIHTFAGTLAVLCLLGSGIALAGSVRCTTYEEKSLGRLQTLCDDGTRATSYWNRSLERWEITMNPPVSSFKSKIQPQPKATRR
jgi:hypothetical protein